MPYVRAGARSWRSTPDLDLGHMHEGVIIRRLREQRGLKQEYVAAEVGISPSQLCRLEKGSKMLGYRLAVRLARVLGCALTDFDHGAAAAAWSAGRL